MTTTLTIYAVRNAEGKWFRGSRRYGAGPRWVDDVRDARIYTRMPQAKARCTFYAKHWPKYGTPEIVSFTTIAA